MRSLRSRLILGSALIAVVPLTVAMLLLSGRIGAMLREQAVERLGAVLSGLRAQLDVDRERVAEQLRILGRDPTLKRLYLLSPEGSRDLSDYLAERRSLLGLGFLRVADSKGTPVAEASATDSAALAIGASAPIVYEGEPVGVVTGGLRLDLPYLQRLKQTSGVDLVLRDAGGQAKAATLEGAERAGAPNGITNRIAIGDRSYWSRGIPLDSASAPGYQVLALVSTVAADRAVQALRVAAAVLGLAAIAMAILMGFLWSSQVSRPVEELAAFSRQLARGDWEEPLSLEGVRELETLATALDGMRHELKTYRGRLVVSERQAAWGQMARKVAHEIKNPLTPIAISVADLKRSYEQRRPDFPSILDQAVRTVGEEVDTLKRLLQEFSEFGRFPAPRLAPCSLPDLLADLEGLYASEVSAGRLSIARPVPDVTWAADAGQIKQALINLIKNGLEALDEKGRVTVVARVELSTLELSVTDTGRGLSAEQRTNLFVPGFTTKATGSGLGLTIVEKIVSDHQGTIAVETGAEGGTSFRIRLPLETRS